MKRINIYIGKDQHKQLVSLVKKRGWSGYSEFVRTAIDQFIDKTGRDDGKGRGHGHK